MGGPPAKAPTTPPWNEKVHKPSIFRHPEDTATVHLDFTNANSRTFRSRSNRSTTRSLPAAASRARSCGLSSNSSSTAASRSGSFGGTRRPWTPSSISSRIPGNVVLTTGNCMAIASTKTFGITSCRPARSTIVLASTKTSASAYRLAASSCGSAPANSTRSLMPSWFARRSNTRRWGPSPTMMQRARCRIFATAASKT